MNKMRSIVLWSLVLLVGLAGPASADYYVVHLACDGSIAGVQTFSGVHHYTPAEIIQMDKDDPDFIHEARGPHFNSQGVFDGCPSAGDTCVNSDPRGTPFCNV